MLGAASERALLEAVSFAARAHRHQLRKDGLTPYVSHPFRVCLVVRHVFGLDEPRLLIAAVLHDTVEDTTTDFDDVAARFGAEVAGWVAGLSKDKRLPEPEREQAYLEQLCRAPWQVQVCKLADIYDNLLDSGGLSADQRQRSLQRAKQYLAALDARPGNEPELVEPVRLVQALVRQLHEAVQLTRQGGNVNVV